jgi:tetratricopeptide (TPR) repeat protein
MGNLDAAENDLAAADELASVFSLSGFVPRIIEARANIARERLLMDKAGELYESALRGYQNAGADPVKADLYYERALYELRRGQLDRALELIDCMIADREQNSREIELALGRQMRARVLLAMGDSSAIAEAESGEPLLRRLRCNYYLAISCYVRSRALAKHDTQKARLALDEFLQLAERFDYSYFIRSEEWFNPAVSEMCRSYSIDSVWLNTALGTDSPVEKPPADRT